MSKLYYDNLLDLGGVEKAIKKVARSPEEREELWQIVDEIVHHRVMGCVLDSLPVEHHTEFLERFEKAPHDESLLGYLKEKIGDNIEELLKQELGDLAYEILQEIKSK
jgi:transcriptional regulator of NAD metabolism